MRFQLSRSRSRGRVFVWVAWTKEDFLREHFTLYELSLSELRDFLIPGPVYRIHNVHDLELYVFARFYDEKIRIGGCILVHVFGKYHYVKLHVPGDLDDFRDFACRFVTARDPVKYLRRYIAKALRRGAVLFKPESKLSEL